MDLNNWKHDSTPAMEIKLERRPKKYTLDNSHRAFSPRQTKRILDSNLSLRNIIVDRKKIQEKPLNIPIYCLQARLIPGESKLDRVMGKGCTPSQSYCSATMEAVERHCCSLFEQDLIVQGVYEQLKDFAVDPLGLGVFRSGSYSPNLPIDWVWAWNLTRNKSVLVPALSGLYISRFLKHWYYEFSDPKTQYTYSDSNGCAAGLFLEEAIAHGIFEVIERDAVTIWARNHIIPPKLEGVAEGRNPYLKRFLRKIRSHKDFFLKVKYLTLDIPVHIMACILQDGNINHTYVGYGAHLDPEIALLRALTELFQAKALLQEKYSSLSSPTLFRGVDLSRLSYLLDEGDRSVRLNDLKRFSTRDNKKDIELCLRLLEEKGFEVIVVDRTRKELSLPAVKVVIPKMQRVDWVWLWERELLAVGSSRVLQVPCQLGLLDQHRKWEELDLTQITYQ